jgi:predicted patatin/cPLA2 family phospholipase
MRSAHGAGFMYALGSMLKIQEPDMVIGVSGNAASALCYAAKAEYQCLKTVWTECLSTPEFISYKHPFRLMNVDYLIDQVFRSKAQSAVAILKTSPIPYYISLVDAETGEVRFISRQDAVDSFELLRAAKAMPVVYGKKIRILGREYIDGAIGQPPQSQVDFALSLGATKILFIDDSPKRSFLGKCITFFYALSVPRGLRENVLKDLFTSRTCLVPTGVELVYIHRDRMPASLFSRNQKKLIDTFELGARDALSLEGKLRELLK